MFKRAERVLLLALTTLFMNGAGATGITPPNPPNPGTPPSGSECPFAPARGGPCWTTEDVIDTRIDHHAQTGLLRMFTRGGNWAAEGSAILCAVKTGALEGVYLPDQKAPALRARDAGSGWWNILPKGQNSTCYQQPPGRAPMIVFGKPVKDNPDLTANALADAWRQCGLQASAPRCYTATISKPAAATSSAGETAIRVKLTTADGRAYSGQAVVTVTNVEAAMDPAGGTQTVIGSGAVMIPVEPGTYFVAAQQHFPNTKNLCPTHRTEMGITINVGQTGTITVPVPDCDLGR